jgi:aminoglycoside phosphotransferase (APT) family kinase protein
MAASLNVSDITRFAPVLSAEGARVVSVAPLGGGASKDLWSVGLDGGRRVVLRRAPDLRVESTFAIPIELEASLVALAGEHGVPSPRVLHVLRPEEGLGAGFFMEHIEGEALGGRIVRSPAFASVRPKLASQCGGILARLHALPREAVSELPMISPLAAIDALERQHRLEAWPRPVFELAFRWLRARAPAPADPSVVHGDFRNGNLLIGDHGVSAVLDWELAHLGDPMEDLGWLCVNSWRFGAIDLPVGGFGVRDDLYAAYEAAGGAQVDRERVRFWEALGTLRWGVICTMSTVALRREGPFGVERAMIARRASETELDLLNLMEGNG